MVYILPALEISYRILGTQRRPTAEVRIQCTQLPLQSGYMQTGRQSIVLHHISSVHHLHTGLLSKNMKR